MYIAEAHASDTWPLGREVSIAASHRRLEDRLACAQRLRTLGLELPMCVDGMDDAFLEAYAAWPERFYVFHEGVVAYVAQPKRAAYCPAELRLWLSLHLRQEKEAQQANAGQGAKARRPQTQGQRRKQAPLPADMEMLFVEAESSLHDLAMEYQQYQDQTAMLSEFDSESTDEERYAEDPEYAAEVDARRELLGLERDSDED